MENPKELKLGITDSLLRLDTSGEHRELAPLLVQQAHRTVNLYTRDLDPAVYDTSEFHDAISEFARRNRHTTVRILVQDPTRAVKEGHRLLRLAQHLSSKIQLRVPGEDYKGHNEAFLVVDDVAYIHRPATDLYSAEANFNDAPEARRLVKYFDEVWERAELDPQLRRLSL
jgi:hypothetical protein